jgi:hypothetical protein
MMVQVFSAKTRAVISSAIADSAPQQHAETGALVGRRSAI